MTVRQFPIQGDWCRKCWKQHLGGTIPWDMIAPHEQQALKNHCGQSLEVLARRGGLGQSEAIAILEDRAWNAMDFDESITKLAAMVQAYVSNAGRVAEK